MDGIHTNVKLNRPTIAVGIATRGRAAVLIEVLRTISQQSRLPDRILVCGTCLEDVAGVDTLSGIEIMFSEPGLCRQRNTILAAIPEADFVLFIDDDFLLAPHYIQATLVAFAQDSDIVVTTGQVIADGAVGPGLPLAEGRDLLMRYEAQAINTGALLPAFNGYGCNMALRLSAVRAANMTFDERLPLYAWFEDVDFTRRLAVSRRIVKVLDSRGVHLGTKQGRTSGSRLGYSQVANPIYLAIKGSYTWRRVIRDLSRHLLINCVKSLRPEPYVDRRGRMRGNVIAFTDLLRGRLRPERILEM